MVEYIPCRKCKGEKYIFSNTTEGYSVVICDCYKEYLRKRSLEVKLINSNLSEKILSYDISSYEGKSSIESINKIKKFVDEFESKFSSKSLFISGGMSTQKTTVSKWIGMKILEKNKTVLYILMNDLLKGLSNMSRNEEEANEIKAIIEKYLAVDLLIVDEAFTKDRNTIYKSRFQIPYLDSFLRSRLETTNKSTIFISNDNIDKIDEETFNPYIKELVKRNCYYLEFKDRVGCTQNVDDIFA